MPVLHAARGDSFESSALRWRDDVYRFALSLTRDESDADDVVQDTYLRAFRSWHTFEPGTDCRRWLFTICRNAFLRSRERLWHRLEVDEGERPVSGTREEGASDLEALFSRVDVGSALDRALRRVPEPFRSALQLVDVQDQSYETAAEALGIPVGTVRSRLFRGRRLMQELLLAHARDAGLRRTA
ncbi:MAG TPA: sigma-70 family RNA polymerase sigma factor [Gemmatimonadaceae bacterium]|nr:sigma-70 family RNA polymerase sigma factor [Gemmatimonadaceae bacterium]